MSEHLWNCLIEAMVRAWMPLVVLYHIFTTNLFLNVAATDAKGLERAGNELLAPFHYLCDGRIAVAEKYPEIPYSFRQRFDYKDNLFWLKTASAALVLPPALFLGCACKAAAFLSKDTRQRHASMQAALVSQRVVSNSSLYEKIGLDLSHNERFEPLWLLRDSAAANHLRAEKEALREIGRLLTEANIPWWVDCGTLLGTYRYGGVIPWDDDLDIAVLLPDHYNIRRILGKLDPNKYMVQDWSCRDNPDSFLKIYLFETKTTLDIYHYELLNGHLRYMLAIDTNCFTPEWFKIRERRFTVPVPFASVFPLKKSSFDGIDVFVPNNTVEYLQRFYGTDLAPAKIYNPLTAQYEKDLTHPYWQAAYAH